MHRSPWFRCQVMMAAVVLVLPAGAIGAEPPAKPRPLLDLPASGSDPQAIDYSRLPRIEGKHGVVCLADTVLKFQLHSYLAYHDGRYWCMWSQGPPVEDEPSQVVRYATSNDGLVWNPPQMLVGPPREGYAYIARGLWQRDGDLVALYAHFKGKGAFGANKELRLEASAWDKATGQWQPRGLVFDNAINNFPPEKLPSGEWLMTRRDSRFNVSVLIGGMKGIADWQTFPVVERRQLPKFSPDEPIWWAQPDGTLVGLYRDNGGSGRLFRSVSTDNGRTWTLPEITNYPNATSKLFSLKLSSGERVLISNANPGIGRRELHLGLSSDGLTFTRLGRLAIPSPRATTFQYPHAIERDGRLLIALSNKKNQIEVLSVPLAEIARLKQEGIAR